MRWGDPRHFYLKAWKSGDDIVVNVGGKVSEVATGSWNI